MPYKKEDFPIKNVFQAREVLETDFSIAEHPYLFVNLDEARNKISRYSNYRAKIKYIFHIDPKTDKISVIPETYKKILFTGFRGSGKSTELYRLYKELSGKDKYFTVFIDLEKEFEMENFEIEDFYFILIYKFAQVLNEYEQLKSKVYLVNEVLDELFNEEEFIKEVKRNYNVDIQAKTGTGINIFNLFKAKIDFKGEFSAGTNIAKIIRKRIRNNPLRIIRKFNNILSGDAFIRNAIIEAGLGQDILFIVDSLEKIDFEVYNKLIGRNSYVIRELNVHLIIAIPILAQFLADQVAEQSYFETVVLPVIPTNDTQNKKLLAEIITKRIDFNTFFENEEVLDYIVEKSGGLIRQLLKLTSFCLLYSDTKKLKLNEVKDMVKEYGRQMFYERLTDEQIDLLKQIKEGKKTVTPANKEENLLLLNLFVLKYNSHYEINPILDEWI